MRTPAHLNVEVGDDGLLHVMEVYEGGFERENPAHCFLRALAQTAGSLSVELIGEPQITTCEVDAHPVFTPVRPVHEPS
jgi:hypothetical protein